MPQREQKQGTTLQKRTCLAHGQGRSRSTVSCVQDNCSYFREAPSSAKPAKTGLKLNRDTSTGQRKWFCWIHTPRFTTELREGLRTPELVLVPTPHPSTGPAARSAAQRAAANCSQNYRPGTRS